MWPFSRIYLLHCKLYLGFFPPSQLGKSSVACIWGQSSISCNPWEWQLFFPFCTIYPSPLLKPFAADDKGLVRLMRLEDRSPLNWCNIFAISHHSDWDPLGFILHFCICIAPCLRFTFYTLSNISGFLKPLTQSLTITPKSHWHGQAGALR